MVATVRERGSCSFDSLNLPHILMEFYRRSCAKTKRRWRMHLAEASVRHSPRTTSDRFKIAISGKKSFIFWKHQFLSFGQWGNVDALLFLFSPRSLLGLKSSFNAKKFRPQTASHTYLRKMFPIQLKLNAFCLSAEQNRTNRVDWVR